MPTNDQKRKEDCQTKVYQREISLPFGKKQPISFLSYWGWNFMDWICQRKERLPELFQRDKLLLHSHVMLFQLSITWDDFLWLPRSQGRFKADPRDLVLQISSASVKGYVMSQNGWGHCQLFCRSILGDMSASLMTRPLCHLPEQISPWLPWGRICFFPFCFMPLPPVRLFLDCVCGHLELAVKQE